MKNSIRRNSYKSTLWAILLLLFMACNQSNEQDLEIQSDTNIVFIDIEVAALLAVAQSGDEVPEFATMYNGEANHATGTSGEANLITELRAGDQIVWQLGDAKGVRLIGFEFFIIEGENVFELPGGQAPILQPNGSWKAITSPNTSGESVIKYNIHFEVEGVGTFWWDPLIKTSSVHT